LFIVFEGIDGCGKSTQVKYLSDHLKRIGHRVYSTCEPTDSRIGSIIRDVFRQQIEADHRTIAGLFVADRLEHLLNKTNGILKVLEEGQTVICDRYYFSSYAYQGVHISQQWVIDANSLSANLLRPDLIVFIDIDPEVSLKRISSARGNLELYETLSNLVKVREKYFEAFESQRQCENIFITDGNRQPEIIAQEIWDEIEKNEWH